MLSRRTFLVTASALAGIRPFVSHATQETVTSGGIGLTLADVRSMYEELPQGQGFRSFAETQSSTALYIDFGDDDFARNIWVSGDLDEAGAFNLITWLCPDDIEPTHLYEVLTSSGSMAYERIVTFDSQFLAGFDPARQSILAKYVRETGDFPVKSLLLTVEQAATSPG